MHARPTANTSVPALCTRECVRITPNPRCCATNPALGTPPTAGGTSNIHSTALKVPLLCLSVKTVHPAHLHMPAREPAGLCCSISAHRAALCCLFCCFLSAPASVPAPASLLLCVLRSAALALPPALDFALLPSVSYALRNITGCCLAAIPQPPFSVFHVAACTCMPPPLQDWLLCAPCAYLQPCHLRNACLYEAGANEALVYECTRDLACCSRHPPCVL